MWVGVAGLVEIKANSASQQSLSWGLAELGNMKTDSLLKERVQLKREIKQVVLDDDVKIKIEKRIKEIEDMIGEDMINDNHKEILETVKAL